MPIKAIFSLILAILAIFWPFFAHKRCRNSAKNGLYGPKFHMDVPKTWGIRVPNSATHFHRGKFTFWPFSCFVGHFRALRVEHFFGHFYQNHVLGQSRSLCIKNRDISQFYYPPPQVRRCAFSLNKNGCIIKIRF